jgi:hypothetical protein
VRVAKDLEVVPWCLERRLSSGRGWEMGMGESKGDEVCEDVFQSIDSSARNSKSSSGDDCW